MKGFDPKFTDFPDYIVGITKEIWEDRGLATMHDYYAPDIVVRMPGSVSTGNQGVIAATAATLAEFPDRTLLGEDVIWSGTPEEGISIWRFNPPSLVNNNKPSVLRSSRPIGINRGAPLGKALRKAV